LNILVCYDFSASSDVALDWVSGLRKIGPCKVTVASVSWPPHERNRIGLAGHSWDNPPEIQKFLERDLRKQCESTLGDVNVQIRVAAAWGRPDPQLIELAQTEHADLMVVGTNQRHGVERFWLGSVSRGILHHAPMSVACIPAPAAAGPIPERVPVFKRVLVPTDFSKLGNQAIPFAYSTLYRGGTVCLFHVIEPRRSRAKAGEAHRQQIKKIEGQLRALTPSEAKARRIVNAEAIRETAGGRQEP
jgi:nucleotide-binding universal stress UspA family protein